MTTRPHVLLASPSGAHEALAQSLLSAGYELTVVGDFGTAREYLDKRPDLLITEIKLGAYNGLHLAIRAGAKRIPTIVIGDADPVLKADAERQQATYLSVPLDERSTVVLIGELLQGSRQTRRSNRKRVPPVKALVNEAPAHLRDVSYEGMRIESPNQDAPPPYFDVRLPQFNFVCRAQRVWTSPASHDASRVWCGAALSTVDGETASAWRALVDLMPGLAVIN
jgi:hypothetical protein